MPVRKGGRKLLICLGIFVLVVVAVWFSMPAWFPRVLRPIARHAGARFASYERIGYQRFQLHQLTFTNSALRFQAEVVETIVPSVWLSKLAFSRNTLMTEFVRVDHWSCEILPSNKPASPSYTKLQAVTGVLKNLSFWVPGAELSDGVVRRGSLEIPIRSARWSRGAFESTLTLPRQASGQELKVVLSPARPASVRLTCDALGLESVLAITTNQAGFQVNSTSTWRSNRFETAASFGPNDTLPQTAVLQAPRIVVPAVMLKLPYYGNLTGSLNGQWQGGKFQLEVSATATPLAEQTNWPVAELKFQASGDTNLARIDKLDLQSPFLGASLASPLDVRFAAPFVQGPARFNLSANLAQQHWFEMEGQVTGTAQVDAGTNRFPEGSLQLLGTQIGNTKLKAGSIEIAASMAWPAVNLTTAVARFDDGSEANAAGRFDLENKTVTNGLFKLNGPLVPAWLPAAYSYQNLALEAKFDGPIEQLNHSGKFDVTNITVPRLKVAALRGAWDGQAKELRHFTVEASTTNALIAAEGSLKLETNVVNLGLSRFSLSTNGATALELQQPLNITYSPRTPSNGWFLDVEGLRLAGSAGAITAQAKVHWPEQGQFNFGLQHVPVALLSAIAPNDFQAFDIGFVEGTGSWSNGPVSLRVAASAKGTLRPRVALDSSATSTLTSAKAHETSAPTSVPSELLSTPLTIDLDLQGDAQGLVLSNLVVTSPTSTVVVAKGSLPLTITPGSVSNLWEMRPEAAMDLHAAVRPEAFFWQSVSELAGITLVDPSLDLSLTGTWRSPQGRILARAREVELQHSTLTNLTLSDLQVDLELDRQRARLVKGQVLVQGQQVSLDGELPLSDRLWKQLFEKRLPSWHEATLQLKINNAQVAAFTPMFPEVLAPQGELNVELRLSPAAGLEGTMTLREARTRPLGNTAPIRDINATMRFSNQVLTLENASANLSGAAVELTGRADMHGTNWMGGELPPFVLTMRGTDVPLARQPEYIVRSDLDLSVIKTNGAPPIVVGSAHLRDSFFLSDITVLVPKKVKTPAGRPPYFSIDNPTVSDWRLAVAVDGVRWLKVRTGLFNGEVTANLHLEGTLKDPIALGGLKIDSGLVRFPFANLELQQGLVTLTSQDPFHPQLLVHATSKQFGYDIRMEVSGSIDSPIIQFTSNPSLSSEQILLMITAGQLPQGALNLTPQQRAQTVALFLRRDLLSKLGFGDQSQERLTISSGEEVSVQNKPTYRVEYKVAPRWSITGEYDRFGDFNAGLKWRVYSK